MIGQVTGKILDVTETGVVKAADGCMKLGAWVVPFCYKRECARIIKEDQDAATEHEAEVEIVAGIGQLALRARCGKAPLGLEVVQNIARLAGPALQSADYEDAAFNPLEIKWLEHVAPLHDENE